MKTLEELKKEYYNDLFTFQSIRRNLVTYKKKYKNKYVTVRCILDYRSELDYTEILSSLDSETELIEIIEL